MSPPDLTDTEQENRGGVERTYVGVSFNIYRGVSIHLHHIQVNSSILGR